MRKIKLLSLLLALVVLSGCGAASVEGGTMPQPEQRLVVYTSHKEEVYRPIIREFEERTGIWVELVTGGSYELLEQIEAEKDAPRADVMFGGGVEIWKATAACSSPPAAPIGARLPRACASRRTAGRPFPPCPWCSSTTPSWWMPASFRAGRI